MLKGIDPLLGADLLHALASMGHGAARLSPHALGPCAVRGIQISTAPKPLRGSKASS
jgi:hypothetical protein